MPFCRFTIAKKKYIRMDAKVPQNKRAPMKKAIITLDIINDLCSSKGKVARYPDRISENKVIAKINSITSWGRNKECLIIHVRLGFRPHYLDSSFISPIFGKAKANKALSIDEWGGQFCKELQIEGDDIQIIKHRVSAFYGTDLDLILRANSVREIIIVGIATNNAVELTAREAHDRDFKVQVIGDATECGSDEEKLASLNFLSRIAEVLSTDQLFQ
jgi:nicotinamidase-related amidase